MGIRGKLNRNRPLGVGVFAGLLMIAAGIICWQWPARSSTLPRQAFYTDDDGATYFEDTASKIVPFDHNGKPAYRAAVFECEQGHRVVAWIYRHNEIGRKGMERYMSEHLADKDTQGTVRAEIESSGMDVRKAGTQKWMRNSASTGDTVVTCPLGHPAQTQVISR